MYTKCVYRYYYYITTRFASVMCFVVARVVGGTNQHIRATLNTRTQPHIAEKHMTTSF